MSPQPFSFLSLPPELRHAIYLLVLSPFTPIHITTLKPKRRSKRTPHTPSFTSLFLLNKQINHEASTLFYTKSIFVVGNGWWGSKRVENCQALRNFVKRVPKARISQIKTLHVVICLSTKSWLEGDITSLAELAKIVVRCFTGVETLCLRVGDVYDLQPVQRVPNLMVRELGGDLEGAAKEVKGVVEGLGGKRLKEVRWLQDGMGLGGLATLVESEGWREIKMSVVEWEDEEYLKLLA